MRPKEVPVVRPKEVPVVLKSPRLARRFRYPLIVGTGMTKVSVAVKCTVEQLHLLQRKPFRIIKIKRPAAEKPTGRRS